jgi:imidazolonepropionase-like amidohydrolase
MCVLTAASCSPDETPLPTDGFVITGARVFDGEVVIEGQSVVVVETRIYEITDTPERWAHLPSIDGTGATLLPGLIDSHAHTHGPGDLADALRFGVTTVLDMHTQPKPDSLLRAAAASRTDVADFRSSGILATAPGGHGTEYGVEIPTVAGPAAAAPFIANRVAGGSDYIKIVLNGVRVPQGFGTLDGPTATALVDAGHEAGLLVVAHIESGDDVRTAVEAGVDGLVHIWRDAGPVPDLARLLAERGVFVIPTIAVPDALSAAGGGVLMAADPRIAPFLSDEQRTAMTPSDEGPTFPNADGPISAVSSLVEAGVTLLVGSDVSNGTTSQGVSVHRELELLVLAGLTPAQALTAATANAAHAFGLTDRGRIRAGATADLLLVRGNPMVDVTATRDIVAIWRSGQRVDRDIGEGGSG